ncbi:EAL domain-containing protein [Ralstonia insidiosa]|nr:bifunctional diguanylate cyclase/phosphodiesterase [Ralstonia insidiosa]
MLLILVQASLAIFSVYLLSTVRAYVGGENLWSKGEKDAIFFLSRYARTGVSADYARYQQAIEIPLGDLAARQALEQLKPNQKAAYDGFLRGGNNPEDIPALIWLFRNFRDIPYLQQSIDDWKKTDASIRELVEVAFNIRDATVRGAPVSDGLRSQFHDRIYTIDQSLTAKSTAFSATLSHGSRKIATWLIALNAITAVFLIILMFLHTRRLVRQRQVFETALKNEKVRAQITLASIGDAVIVTDANRRITYINPAAERLLGQTLTTAIGALSEEVFGVADSGFDNAGGLSQLLVREDGSAVPVSIQRSALGAADQDAGTVSVFHDRTSEERLIAQLSWQATHDELTGLANRRNFEQRIEAAIRCLAEHQATHYLMFIDLDQFKIVNDTCGHAAGDQVLQQVATILQGGLSITDLLARMGGDEFAVLAEDCELDTAIGLAERLRLAVESTPFQWEDRVFNITVSIGIVPVTDAGTTREEMLRVADIACYIAKENGRNRVEVQRADDLDLHKHFGEMEWVQKIRHALEQDRFLLYAQEIRPLARKEAGLRIELLLRLRDERGAILSPGLFIPAAERYGLMPTIDRWVVREAFRIIATHLANPATQRITYCAINLSGASFNDDAFVGHIRQHAELYGVPPSIIRFEITETSAITDLAGARRFINELRELGFCFVLDDFGNGMSSLRYLKQLPVNCIKIDGNFVRDILDDHISRAMVEMIGRVGKLMNLETVAEFVENDAIIAVLSEIGIDYGQGDAIGRPEPFAVCTPVHAALQASGDPIPLLEDDE